MKDLFKWLCKNALHYGYVYGKKLLVFTWINAKKGYVKLKIYLQKQKEIEQLVEEYSAAKIDKDQNRESEVLQKMNSDFSHEDFEQVLQRLVKKEVKKSERAQD